LAEAIPLAQTLESITIIVSGVIAAGQQLDLDCQGFIGKPIDSDELRELVSAMLNN
jgi:hypothetical protein